MTDSELRISKNAAVAFVAYGVAVALIVVMWVNGDRRYGITGVVVAGVGAVAMVRMYLIRFADVARNSFELGRDSVTRLERR